MDNHQASAKDHALSHGLTIDVKKSYAYSLDALVESLRYTAYPTSLEGLTDPSDLPNVVLPTVLLPVEPDIAQQSSLALLDDSTAEIDQTKLTRLALESSLPPVRKIPKWELPTLKSDPEFDSRVVSRDILDVLDVRFSRYLLPLEPLDERKDEGLDFPESAKRYHQDLVNDIQTEELDYSEEDLTRLAEALHQDLTADDLVAIRSAEWNDSRDRVRSFTPILSTMEEECEPYIPDTVVCRLEIPSDPSSLLSHDLEMAENTLKTMYGSPDPPDSPSPSFSILDVSPIGGHALEISLKRIKTSELKIETPIMRDDHASPSAPGLHVGLSPTVVGSLPLGCLTTGDEYAELSLDEPETFQEQFYDVIEARTAHLLKAIEQEQLDIIDTTARLAVPVLDFNIPMPDWQDFATTGLTLFRWFHSYYRDKFVFPEWAKNSREERRLWWNPFKTAVPTIALHETFGDQQSLDSFLQFNNNVSILTSADFVWKSPGVAVLRGNDSDEDITHTPPSSVSTSATSENLMSLVRKRHVELDKLNSTENKTRTTCDQTRNLLVGQSEFNAATKLLDNYMDLYAHKKMKLGTSKFFLDHESPPNVCKSWIETGNATRSIQTVSNIQSVLLATPCPILQLKSCPRSVIISTTLGRPLISGIQRLLPEIDLIDRDFSKHNIWHRSSDLKQVQVVSSLAFEADVIVSPATGIIVTSMLSVRQKPIPGSNAQTQIRERVLKVAHLYEQLYVLVSESNPLGEYGDALTDSDAQAFSEFTAFVSSFGGTVRTYYIAGGHQTLAKWTVFFVCKYSHQANVQQDPLVMKESSWETILRRAGMNIYAAQVMIGVLKSEYGDFGLMQFLAMNTLERIAAFEGYFGGQRLLERVSSALELRWM